VDKARAAASAVTDLEQTVRCSVGNCATQEYFWQIKMFRGLPAHDIAVAIGIAPSLPEPLIGGRWEEISPLAQEWRRIGIFPPAIAEAEDAPLLERPLGLTGRAKPHAA
jgi:hypothetical protein